MGGKLQMIDLKKINTTKIKKIKDEMGTKKLLTIGIVFGIIFLLIIGSILFFRFKNKNGKTKNVVYVNSVKQIMNPGADTGRINRYAGVVETQKQVEIQPSQDRTIKEVFVEEGQEVSIGTLLFSYDTEQDEDKLNKAQLELERIQNDIVTKQSAIGIAQQSGDQLEVLQAQTELKQSEYEKKTKEVEIQKIKDAIENAEVKSQMKGIVKSIKKVEESAMEAPSESNAFMTIIAMGDFRIKGKVNEQNVSSIMPGQQVIVHSRVDQKVIWKGTMSEVDMQRPENGSENGFMGDPTTQSNSYPFYVNLESSEGLMLGQHVYIEPDFGQTKEHKGLWLDESFVVQDGKSAYVWADNGRGKLEKREVEIGKRDEEMFQCEIKKGLSDKDLVTFPEPGLKEGMKTAKGKNNELGMSNPELPENSKESDSPKNQGEEEIPTNPENQNNEMGDKS